MLCYLKYTTNHGLHILRYIDPNLYVYSDADWTTYHSDSKMKHLEVDFHFVRHHIECQTLEVVHFRTVYQLVDAFTNALPHKSFHYLVSKMLLLIS
ncbi:hypothetical protein V6Z11_A05G395300 [Gossypium hirsutum]